MIGYVLSCSHCGETFVICKSCYRGHKYCSKSCREAGYESSRIKARRKYNQSIEAKLDHRDRNRKYRLKSYQKNVMDKTSVSSQNELNLNTQDLIHDELEKLTKKDGVCISCLKTIFKQGVNIYERST